MAVGAERIGGSGDPDGRSAFHSGISPNTLRVTREVLHPQVREQVLRRRSLASGNGRQNLGNGAEAGRESGSTGMLKLVKGAILRIPRSYTTGPRTAKDIMYDEQVARAFDESLIDTEGQILTFPEAEA